MKTNILLSLLIAITWGFFPFLSVYVLKYISANIYLLLLSFTFFSAMCIYNLVFYKGNLFSHLRTIKQNVLLAVILAGFFALFLNSLLYVYIINTGPALNISIALVSVSSMISLLVGIVLLKNELSLGSIIGVALMCLGVYIMLRFSKSIV